MAQQLANGLTRLVADERIRGPAAQSENGTRQTVELGDDVILMDYVDHNVLQRIVVDAKAPRRQIHAWSRYCHDRYLRACGHHLGNPSSQTVSRQDYLVCVCWPFLHTLTAWMSA